jgi:hypothetical protein
MSYSVNELLCQWATLSMGYSVNELVSMSYSVINELG